MFKIEVECGMTRPVDDGFYMPAEWVPHRRCWMAWPWRSDRLGDEVAAVRDEFIELARAIAEFEPVSVVAVPDELAEASLRLGAGVGCLPMNQDGSRLRDFGPTFLVDRRGGLAGADWGFNAWGGKYPDYAKDAEVAQQILEHVGAERYEAPLVLEGGSVQADGEGTLLTSEQCLLNPSRNPDLTKPQIEDLLGAYLGVRQIIWLGQGLLGDEGDGHVGILACFIAPGRVLALTSNDPEDDNYSALQDNLERLSRAKDAQGRPLEILTVEQPKASFGDDGVRLPLSYVDFYLANGGLVMPSFEDSNDQGAFDLVSRIFPDRTVRQVLTIDLLRAGGIHALTQPEPDPNPDPGGD